MKHLQYLIVILTLSISGFSQKPETVHSIIKIHKEKSWYTTQYSLWEKEIKKDAKNKSAWVNYYAAARMAKLTSNNAEEKEKWMSNMSDIIKKIEKHIKGTYEYYHIKCWDSSVWEMTTEKGKEELIGWAEKAYALAPERTEVYPDLMNAHMLRMNREKMTELSKQWFKSGEISPTLAAMNYNMLMSTEENAIIITAGDNDTYPALVLQNAQNIRPDITIINVFCASASEEYRNNLFSLLDIPATEDTLQNHLDFIDYVIEHKGDHPLYFSHGHYINHSEKLQNNTYNVGLTMRYCENDFNNTSVLIHNFESRFLLDHLTFSVFNDPFPEQAKRYNLSYVPGLTVLYHHYCVMKDEIRKSETETLIRSIASGTMHEEKILESLKQN